jgi:hypothetical protein
VYPAKASLLRDLTQAKQGTKAVTAVVLLGAGASAGSVDARFAGNIGPKAPPLGSTLFDELECQGGIASVLPDSLKASFRDNFEVGMMHLFKDQPGDLMRFQRELAHYLALFTPGRESVYVKMLRHLRLNRVIYSSLNYDLLLELSAGLLGHRIAYNPVKQDRTVRLLKLHGSANFWPDTGSIILHNVSVVNYNIQGTDIEAPVKICDHNETLRRCTAESSLAPAIAMYAHGKSVRVSSDYVSQQQAWWAEEIGRASMIFVVGVRVNPADNHIWDALGQTHARMTYFGFEESRTAFTHWKMARTKRNAFFEVANFEQSISLMKKKLNSGRM